jgi:dynein assembly factor 1
LDKFHGCKALWLDSNGFSKIENLAPLVELRCLYLSKNLVCRIEGLEALQHLTILDLSNNRLASIDNLSCCPNLQTLNVSHNFLTTVDSISHLKECPALNNIDITNNRLETDEAFLGLFSAVPALVALSINGNEVTKLGTFRKRMIAGIPKLGYLDRPIDLQERTFAEAFVAGGAEAESAAREQWKRDVEKKRVDELATFKAWQEEQKVIREAARAEGRSLITEVWRLPKFPNVSNFRTSSRCTCCNRCKILAFLCLVYSRGAGAAQGGS